MQALELLAPAGDMEKLQVAVAYGADAVYLGGKNFGLRAAAAVFSVKDIARAVDYAHGRNVNVYVTVNVFAHNRDLDRLPEYLRQLEIAGVDAIIVSDPGILYLARETVPTLPVHLSTQANTTNRLSALFWEKQALKRIVLARELSLEEIKEIRNTVKLELEVFVHGAMCISYSGRCLLSNYLTGRDANRGDCAQACRWKYSLLEEKRPGKYLPVHEDTRGTYILNSRDLCLLHRLPGLANAGVNSFKIEGRAKSIHYVATVTKTYREAIDFLSVHGPEDFRVSRRWTDEIGKVSNREYTTGFIDGPPGGTASSSVNGIYRRPYTFVGVVKGGTKMDATAVEQRNLFSIGDWLEIMPPRGEISEFRVTAMYDEQGRPIARAPHPRQTVYLPGLPPAPPLSMLRRREKV